MDRPKKLADLTLVSKYYPVVRDPSVANYSYPRSEIIGHGTASTAQSPNDRSSFGSTASIPGLIDDRSDISEVDSEDDYQYQSVGAEIWDSFWLPRPREKQEEVLAHPRRQYPALVPSPHRPRQKSESRLRNTSSAWPLPDGPMADRLRKPAATYSPFPRPIALPSRSPKGTPSWTSSRERSKPTRPPRPEVSQIPTCVRLRLPPPDGPERPLSARDQPALAEALPTVTLLAPRQDPVHDRPSTSQCHHETIYSLPSANNSASQLTPPHAMSELHPRALVHHKSTPQLAPHFRSVFEEDEESEPERPSSRSFFRFHKRSDSDQRRAAKAAANTAPSVGAAGQRERADTVPSKSRSKEADGACEDGRQRAETAPGRKRPAGEVFSRMLGRRSR